jgi:ADP-ribose pyrophosphatase YjhB (NUDIX family)
MIERAGLWLTDGEVAPLVRRAPRSDADDVGLWSVPGGHLESSESPLAAAEREFVWADETWLDVNWGVLHPGLRRQIAVRRAVRRLVSRTGRMQVFDVERFRRDFLMLMKNATVARTYKQAQAWLDAMRRWREHFEPFVFDHLLGTLSGAAWRKEIEKNDADYWEKKIRSAVWQFTTELQPPIESDAWIRHSGMSPERALADFIRDLPRWDRRIRGKAQDVWRVLRDFVGWWEQRRGEKAVVDVPEVRVETLEGFQVKITGYDPGNVRDADSMERLREGLRRYRQRAAQVLPLLLRAQLPLVIDFRCGLDEGGKYEVDHVEVCPGAAHANPGRMAQILAHEMGHHLWRTYLSKDDQDFWSKAITGNYGTLDLAEVLRRYGTTSDFYDNARIRREDPLLYLQIQGIWHDPSYKRQFDNILMMDRLREYVERGGETRLTVHGKPITAYAAKNSEEAFCEALGMLVGYGPRTVLPEVREWLRTILPPIRIAGGDAQADFLAEFFRRHPKLQRFRGVRVVSKDIGQASHPEARQHGDEIWLFRKFWKLPSQTKDFVFAHEIGHLVLSRFGLSKFVDMAQDHGIDMWDVGALPFGQHNMEEAFADAFAIYYLDLGELRARYPAWVDLVEAIDRRVSRVAVGGLLATFMNVPPTELARRLRSEKDPAKREAMRRALEAWRLVEGNPLAKGAQGNRERPGCPLDALDGRVLRITRRWLASLARL